MRNLVTESFVEECKRLYELEVSLHPNDTIVETNARETLIILLKSDYKYASNPIIDLIMNYEIKSFDIGYIHFYPWDERVEYEDYLVIGSDGAGEFIAIDRNTDKIVMIDGYGDYETTWCNSAEGFLNNLIKVGRANILDLSKEEKIKIVKEIEKETGGNKDLYEEILIF